VVKTTSGWIGRGEVVEVEFDPATVAFASLVKQAIEKKAASRVIARSEAQQKTARLILGRAVPRSDEPVRVDDEKYYVSRTALRHVPMFPLQATRVNGRVGARKSFDDLLSPSQRRLLEDVKAHPKAGWPVAIGKDFLPAWRDALKTRDGIRR
jgi:hypothetical protein